MVLKLNFSLCCQNFLFCKFLVNGKGTRTFIGEDLSHIHKVIKEVVLNGKRINVKNLNEKLEDELKKLKLPQQHPDSTSY
jgi:hypothetical protein